MKKQRMAYPVVFMLLTCAFTMSGCAPGETVTPVEAEVEKPPVMVEMELPDRVTVENGGVLATMKDVAEEDITDVEHGTLPEDFTRVLRHAVTNQISPSRAKAAGFDQNTYWFNQVYLGGDVDGWAFDSPRLELFCGLAENIVRVTLRSSDQEDTAYVQDAQLYQLIRHTLEYDAVIDQESFVKYQDDLMAKAGEILAEQNQNGTYVGYEVTRFAPLWDYVNVSDGGNVTIYQFDFALLPQAVEDIGWFGGLYLDSQCRVQGLNVGDFAVKQVDGKPVAVTFLPGDFQLEPQSQEAMEFVNNALVGSLYSDENIVISMLLEGYPEEDTAQVIHKEDYTIAVPTQDWVEVWKGHWEAIVNGDVTMDILCLETDDLQAVAQDYLGGTGEVIPWMDKDTVFVENLKNASFVMDVGTSKHGHYYAVGRCPMEAMEGWGIRMRYIWETIVLT